MEAVESKEITVKCPFCNSDNIDYPVEDVGEPPYEGTVQSGPAFCKGCGAQEEYDENKNVVWVKSAVKSEL